MTAVCGLMVSTMLTTGCQYDDDDVWNEIENVKGEISKLKTQVDQMQNLLNKLNTGKGIVSVTESADGYVIGFSDQTSISIKHGKDGANGNNGAAGKDGSQIGVKEEGGVQYWTIDGEFLLVNDQKVAVTGNDGRTPVLGIDAEGFWCVDGNRVLVDEKPVAAQGDSFFKGIEQQGNEVIFTLADGSSFNVPMSTGALLAFEQEAILLGEGEAVLNYTANGLTFVALDVVPAGVKATLNEEDKTIAISIQSGFVSGSRLILKGADKNGYAMLASIRLVKPSSLKDADFLVLNEGQFGTESGTINAYYQGVWDYRIYKAANENETLGNTSTVGVQNGDYLYIVSKDGNQLVEAEAATMKKRSVLKLDGGQGSNFAAVSASKGYFSTTNGVYEVSLNPLKLGKLVYEGNVGDIYNADGQIYFISSKKAYTFDSSADAAPTEVCNAAIGFTRTGDYLWAANKQELVKINLKDQTQTTVPATCSLTWNAWAYTPSPLCASTDGNYVFFTSGDDVKQMEVTTGNVKTIFSIPSKMEFYGQQLGINPKTNHIYAIATESGWGEHYLTNEIYEVKHDSGELVRTIDYSGTYWFPSSVIFLK